MSYITHYTKLDILLNHILDENRFLLNSLSETNDPYEYGIRYPMVSKSGKEDSDTDRILNYIEYVIRDIKVGCFLTEPRAKTSDYTDLTSIKNPPLWAHYGENHSGVAIVFDKEQFINSCKKLTKFEWAIKSDPVEYEEELHLSDSHPQHVIQDELEEITEQGIAKYIFNNAKSCWFKKHKKWEYEDEFRIMIYIKNSPKVYVDISSSIKAIVFGEKVSDFVIDAVKPKCKELGISCNQIIFNETNNHYFCKKL